MSFCLLNVTAGSPRLFIQLNGMISVVSTTGILCGYIHSCPVSVLCTQQKDLYFSPVSWSTNGKGRGKVHFVSLVDTSSCSTCRSKSVSVHAARSQLTITTRKKSNDINCWIQLRKKRVFFVQFSGRWQKAVFRLLHITGLFVKTLPTERNNVKPQKVVLEFLECFRKFQKLCLFS